MDMICRLEKCTGCSLCANVCPKGCVKMQLDADGFLYPEIDKNRCVECGLCRTTCPANGKSELAENRPSEVYKSYSMDDETLKRSTSGGVFTELATWVFCQRSGVVYGVAFDEDFSAYHTRATNMSELAGMRGSKYIGSHVGVIYRNVKEDLENGCTVMFVGTPCQVAALRKYLSGKIYERLLTCDFICHGVGSETVFQKSIGYWEKEYQDKVVGVRLRTKDFGYTSMSMAVELGNCHRMVQPFYGSCFGYPFSISMINRVSCSTCPYACVNRVSDITMADCICDLTKNEKSKGASLVLINTNNGSKVFKECVNIKSVQSTLEFATKVQSCLNRPQACHPQREEVFVALKTEPFENVVHKFFCPPPKPNLVQRVFNKGKRIIKRVIDRND